MCTHLHICFIQWLLQFCAGCCDFTQPRSACFFIEIPQISKVMSIQVLPNIWNLHFVSTLHCQQWQSYILSFGLYLMPIWLPLHNSLDPKEMIIKYKGVSSTYEIMSVFNCWVDKTQVSYIRSWLHVIYYGLFHYTCFWSFISLRHIKRLNIFFEVVLWKIKGMGGKSVWWGGKAC